MGARNDSQRRCAEIFSFENSEKRKASMLADILKSIAAEADDLAISVVCASSLFLSSST
jgi:2-phospho-L-lactate guanylyltransferase (CobY/MobA/RfbA family)